MSFRTQGNKRGKYSNACPRCTAALLPGNFVKKRRRVLRGVKMNVTWRTCKGNLATLYIRDAHGRDSGKFYTVVQLFFPLCLP
ncbi:hypothetical protein ETAR_03600 [Edwardsiella tarda]|nr:hypothetical protein GBS0709_03640 [Edwardsiella tarda]